MVPVAMYNLPSKSGDLSTILLMIFFAITRPQFVTLQRLQRAKNFSAPFSFEGNQKSDSPISSS